MNYFSVFVEGRVRGDIALNIGRTKITTTKCAHPLCDERTNLHVVSLGTRKDVLQNERIYIPKLVKACTQHLGSESWSEAPIDDLECMYTANQIEEMVDLLRAESRTSRRNAPGNKNKALTIVIIL